MSFYHFTAYCHHHVFLTRLFTLLGYGKQCFFNGKGRFDKSGVLEGDVLENQHIKNQVADAAINVKEGSSLRAALDNTKMFPPMMMHMIASGEKSGELQQMLARAADNQDREFEALIGVSLKVFEPLLIVSMAGIVLFIVMAILQPILALNNMVNI